MGLRHLERASTDTHIRISLTWEPFFLNTNIPPEGEDLLHHLLKKYGPIATERYGGDDNPLRRAGRACDPPIAFRNERSIYPTDKCHAVMEHLKGLDQNEEANHVMEIMFRRYFEEGCRINGNDILSEILVEANLSPTIVETVDSNDDLTQLVCRKDREFKTKLRVSGVPFFIFHRNDGGRAQAFSGAQPVEMMAEQLEDAANS